MLCSHIVYCGFCKMSDVLHGYTAFHFCSVIKLEVLCHAITFCRTADVILKVHYLNQEWFAKLRAQLLLSS